MDLENWINSALLCFPSILTPKRCFNILDIFGDSESRHSGCFWHFVLKFREVVRIYGWYFVILWMQVEWWGHSEVCFRTCWATLIFYPLSLPQPHLVKLWPLIFLNIYYFSILRECVHSRPNTFGTKRLSLLVLAWFEPNEPNPLTKFWIPWWYHMRLSYHHKQRTMLALYLQMIWCTHSPNSLL